MPAQGTAEPARVPARPAALRPVCTTAPKPAVVVRPVPEAVGGTDLEARLAAANQRAAELEEQLAAAVAARDAAEHHAADLEDRNRELAGDLDNALDQLSGHALHAEQERLFHVPRWSPWTASADREGYDR